MNRIERTLTKTLSKHLDDQQAFDANQQRIKREAELLALLSTVIRQKGSEDAEDEDYANHSKQLSSAAQLMVESVRMKDLTAARTAVGKIKNACTRCHEEYR